MISWFLPQTPTPASLSIAAFVLVAIVLAFRIVGRVRVGDEYTLKVFITLAAVAAVFAVYAQFDTMGLLSSGNMVALVGTIGIFVLGVLAIQQQLREPGRFWVSRLPLTALLVVALALVLALFGYSQNGASSASGAPNMLWWGTYRVILVVADVISFATMLYAIIGGIVLGSIALKRRFWP